MPLIALSGALLGGALGSVLPGHAYNVTLETTGTATVGQSLQEYEASVLARVAALSGREKVPGKARGTITVNQDGVVVAVDVTGTPGAAMVRKLKAARFAKIPGLESSGTIKLDFSIAELASPPYSREAVAMRGDNLVMSNEKPAAIAATRTHLISSRQALPVPYSEADRNFDREIVSLYKQLPSFVLEARRHRRSNDVSEEQLQSELLRCRKQENWAGACNAILTMLKAPVEKSELGTVKEWLEMLEDMSGRLDEGGKRSVILALIELATRSSHRPESVVGRELLLREAEVLLNRDSDDDPSIRLILARAMASHYQRARNQEQERKANLDVLKYTLAVEPVDLSAAIRAYQTVMGDRMSAGDHTGARATLDEYRTFVEKRLGAESLELIPVMVSSLETEADVEKRNELISSISKLVDSYQPAPVFDILGVRRDDSGRNAVSALRAGTYYRGPVVQSLGDTVTLSMARLAYKLQLKISGFDQGLFSNLCRVLDSQGKFEQVVAFYRETVAFIEARGSDSELVGYLPYLRRGYASALKRIGSDETADSVMKSIKEAEAKREKAAIERAEARITEIEKVPAPDPIRLLDARLSLIRLYRELDDKKIVAQLEKMSQDLSRSPAERIRPGYDAHLILSLRSIQRLYRDSVFEKPLVDLFRTLNERTPGGLSRNALQILSPSRFGSSAPNFNAVLNALGDREGSAGR